MATPESKVKARVKKVLSEFDAYVVMPATGGYGNSGAPDFLACIKGRFFGIECKAGSNKPTDLQVMNLMRIVETGGFAFVVNEVTVVNLADNIRAKLDEVEQS